jgi:hypothetical protein
MGKGAKAALLQNSGTAQQRSGQLYNEAQQGYGQLDPLLEQEATNPQGYTPQQMAYMNTASQQSLGGGEAATTGQANLEAARSRNAGGFNSAVGTANRATQRQASQNALGIQEQQANLQQAQKQQALSALQSLYGTNLAGSEGYLNTSTTALNAENQAPNFWQQMLKMGANAGAAYAASNGSGGIPSLGSGG